MSSCLHDEGVTPTRSVKPTEVSTRERQDDQTRSLAQKRWLRKFHSADDSSPQLVCFPHAGGSATYFRALSAALAPEIAVLSVQYPGRQDRRKDTPIDDLTILANQISDVIADMPSPVSLFGHSMGGLVAFEVARILKSRSISLAHLYVSGVQPPRYPRPAHLNIASDDTLLAEIQRLSGSEPAVFDNEELRRDMLTTARNDFRILESYRYRANGHGPDLHCPITSIVGNSDPLVTPTDAEGWRLHTGGKFDQRSYHGGHFYTSSAVNDIQKLVQQQLLDSYRKAYPSDPQSEHISPHQPDTEVQDDDPGS